jgi:ABC-type phosphate transport system substrate-binding protein
MKQFITAYEKACSGQELQYTANGSGNGIAEFLGNQTDFGGTDTPLSEQNGEYAKAKERCGGSDAWHLTAAKVKNTKGAITYNEWFAQAHQLFTAKIVTSAGPKPVGISAQTVGRTISAAKVGVSGNDLVLDLSSFYKPTQADAYPIVLATYELVCSKYPEAEVGKAVRAFLQAAIGPGQSKLEDQGYFPLPADFQSKVSSAVNAIG